MPLLKDLRANIFPILTADFCKLDRGPYRKKLIRVVVTVIKWNDYLDCGKRQLNTGLTVRTEKFVVISVIL